MLTPNIYLGKPGGVFPSSFRAENLYEFQNKRISASSFGYIHISLLRNLIVKGNKGRVPNQTILSSTLPVSKTACIKRSAKTRIRNTGVIEICNI
jgi:hypothetical protein